MLKKMPSCEGLWTPQ